MSAISQMWPDRSGSPDLAVLFAAVEAFPGSLAVVESGVVVYVNPAWARTFELVDTSQGPGRAVEDFISGPIPMEGNGSAKILPMAELEKQTILGTIAQLNGDKLLAARTLGIWKTTLYRKLKEYVTQD